MPSRKKRKKTLPGSVSPQETRAREEIAALARATRAQKKAKALALSLGRATKACDAAFLASASILAARLNYELVEKREPA